MRQRPNTVDEAADTNRCGQERLRAGGRLKEYLLMPDDGSLYRYRSDTGEMLTAVISFNDQPGNTIRAFCGHDAIASNSRATSPALTCCGQELRRLRSGAAMPCSDFHSSWWAAK